MVLSDMVSSAQHRCLMACVLVGLFSVVQYEIWGSTQGLTHYFSLAIQVEQHARDNETFEQGNQTLAKQVIALEHSKAALEHQARLRLNYIKQGERFYRYS
ncbi:MAG: hypothetical protein CMF51_00800 [Legionellales bacterium]|nr:hypothetical protein [Legionellales bacterium]|tara:strand:+ start:2255 stop:2557 length:303 start_codon:yes stop_codon:yes gene_type:complete